MGMESFEFGGCWMETFNLPHNFLLGTATSSLQIEGGDRNNNWYRWCEQKKIKDGSSCVVADDHWNLYHSDIALLKELHNDTYRMGLEWSRIEPEPGKFDGEALTHYRDELTGLIKNGIQPLVTLHHFSHPLWIEDMGGWENPIVVDYFAKYTRQVVESLGDLVEAWITINEPNVFTTYGYLQGLWPPGKQNMAASFRVLKNMIQAHIVSYQLIHRIRAEKNFPGETMVGVSHHLRVFDPVGDKPLNRLSAKLIRYFFQDIIVAGMATGKLKFPLGTGGYPFGKGRYQDFLGINYYTRDMVRFQWNSAMMFSQLSLKAGALTNDLGWEIYPDGLYRLCKHYYGKYQLPIFITENGICDQNDNRRVQFIYDHLRAVSKLIQEGVPVQRYYHWSFIDNFEWLEGENARFGLVSNDFRTQTRTVRQSGRFFAELCQNKAVTPKMILHYFN
jgi:beta-glucosidase